MSERKKPTHPHTENKHKNTKTTTSNKKQKQKHQPTTTTHTPSSISFKPCTDVKGLKFGAQFIVKSFTVRRSRPSELPLLLNLNLQGGTPSSPPCTPSFPSTIAFLPTNFTILAHHAWHTLTLGLGTRKSKVIIFIFDTPESKSARDLTWPTELPLGEVNRKLVRGMGDSYEMARFKFRKGCITFYVFAVRKTGGRVFQCGEDLRTILHAVDQLKDFVDHTAMLALPNQRSINYHYYDCNGDGHPQSHPVAAH